VSLLRPLPQRAERAETLEDCPLGVCDGSGWILDDQDHARECQCRQRRISRAAHARLGTGIPKRFRGVSFDRKPICDLEPVILRHIRRFVDGIDGNLDEGRGLWFHGDVGTGKTSLAMLVAQAADNAGRSVAVYSVPHLLAEIRSTYDRDSSGSYLELFDRLCTVDLLVLDDLGAEKTTEWVLEQLYSIVNERWQSSGSVLVTTNAPELRRGTVLDELRREVAEIRRLRESGSRVEYLRDAAQSLERSIARLAELEPMGDADPLVRLRGQLGARTVSRLIEICDDPIPIMGPDLRMAAGGG
jgi:DNA replication protein DnaC